MNRPLVIWSVCHSFLSFFKSHFFFSFSFFLDFSSPLYLAFACLFCLFMLKCFFFFVVAVIVVDDVAFVVAIIVDLLACLFFVCLFFSSSFFPFFSFFSLFFFFFFGAVIMGSFSSVSFCIQYIAPYTAFVFRSSDLCQNNSFSFSSVCFCFVCYFADAFLSRLTEFFSSFRYCL